MVLHKSTYLLIVDSIEREDHVLVHRLHKSCSILVKLDHLPQQILYLVYIYLVSHHVVHSLEHLLIIDVSIHSSLNYGL